MELVGRSSWDQQKADEVENKSAMQFKSNLLLGRAVKDMAEIDIIIRRMERKINPDRFR